MNHRFQDLRRDAAACGTSDRYAHASSDGSAQVRDAASAFRQSSSEAAEEAKGVAASIAEQARARLNEIVSQQKTAGADKIAGVARAAHSAAGDLDETNPHLGRLVRTAADSVDRIAEDVRSRDLGEVFATLADFGRRQPVAFFGGAVVAGFLVSRFFKSDAPLVDGAALRGDRAV
ncbi:hypothetical protein [Lichenibacterium dinghuense]|uniref:hypothetical protein n=1 Tax=Lichenibacterium dinghuense TaxID=2895977 RepID=UPI001F3593D0|nr:hypothetical protein [Lichenibacterium sp. 6Y81]